MIKGRKKRVSVEEQRQEAWWKTGTNDGRKEDNKKGDMKKIRKKSENSNKLYPPPRFYQPLFIITSFPLTDGHGTLYIIHKTPWSIFLCSWYIDRCPGTPYVRYYWMRWFVWVEVYGVIKPDFTRTVFSSFQNLIIFAQLRSNKRMRN